MNDDLLMEDRRPSGRLILPSLVITHFVMTPPAILTALLMIDIGFTFGCSVGVMGQLATISSILAVIASLIMGALSIRFKPKSLLMVGLLFLIISALGCGLASGFDVMLVVYSLSGLGGAMVGPMSYTLVAENFPLEKRTSAIGWLYAGSSLSYVIGAPAISFISGLGGWRSAFLEYILPISILSLFLASIGLPSKSRNIQPTEGKVGYFDGFKEVVRNRSAFSCLVGLALMNAGYMAVYYYGPSFFRQRFMVSTGLNSIFIMVSALCFTFGSLVSGQLVNRYGRKIPIIMTAFLSGAFVILYTLLPNLWLSLIFRCLVSLFSGMAITAGSSLNLEQVPRFRGTMMSISYTAGSVGTALGSGLGGLIILFFNYESIGMTLGFMYIIAIVIYYFLVVDPTRSAVRETRRRSSSH